MKEKILCGLDLGSSKVCAVIAGYLPGKDSINIMGVGVSDCDGLKHGVVVNVESTYRAISSAIDFAEEEAEVKVKNVIVNINGNHIEGYIHKGSERPRSGREITIEDVQRAVNSAQAISLSSDRQIIHSIPLDFKIDNRPGVKDPVGMEAHHLQATIMLITGDNAPINNLKNCVARNGLGVTETVASVLGPALSVVACEEKELGCVLVDIGAQTVNVAVFSEGCLDYIGEIDIGADYITYDMAHGLRTSFKEAKRIKEKFGSAYSENTFDDEIEYTAVDGQSRKKAKTSRINEIIEPRVDEIIDYISEEIKKSGKGRFVPGGIIISGGGAELKGMEEALSKKIPDLPVRLGRPRSITGKAELVNCSAFATPVGLIEYALEKEIDLTPSAAGGRGFWMKLKNWFEELF
ncbi:MAG: cell division protein FtsA [Elusimicrobiota bacterium]